MTTHYNLENIRTLLTEGFSDEELRSFCFDRSDFRPVHNQLSEGTGKSKIVDRLVTHADRKELFCPLFAWAKEQNPAKYRKYQPYYSTAPPTTSSGDHGKSERTYNINWQSETSLKPKHFFANSDYLCLIDRNALHFFSPDNGERLFSSLTTLGDFSLTEYNIIGGSIDSFGNLFLTLLPSSWGGKAYLLTLKFKKGETQPVVTQVYKASGAQLSAPMVEGETICLIQSGPELVVFEIDHYEQPQHIIPLPDVYDWHKSCVSLAHAANHLCLALCDGTILGLDRNIKQPLIMLCQKSDQHSLSALATDGWWLFCGTSVNQEIPSSGQIYAVDAAIGQEKWHFEIPVEDFSGQYRSVKRGPLVLKNTVYVVAGHYLYALNIDTGEELWRYQMPHSIISGPGWTGQAIIVVDRRGNVAALQVGTPKFEIAYHYDLDTPPTYSEWHPLNVTLVNTGACIAFNTTLRLHSDEFKGISEHHTQELFTIRPDEVKRSVINFKPVGKGSTVPMPIIIEYEYHGGKESQQFALSLPVRNPGDEPILAGDGQFFPDGKWQYNFTALRALLIAGLTDRELTGLCRKHFLPVHENLKRDTNQAQKVGLLVDYVVKEQEAERLLTLLQRFVRDKKVMCLIFRQRNQRV